MKRALSLFLALMALLPLAAAQYDGLYIDALLPEEIPETPKGMHHYLLLCVDQWRGSLTALGNSDGMVLVTVDEGKGRIITTALMRDMLVLRPDGKPGRITHIMSHYGVKGLIETINRHFGVQVEKYILMDWNQVQAIVDAVGGVQLTVSAEEASYLRRYAISPRSTTPAMASAGSYHFTGHAAVIYMRIRRVDALNGDAHDIGRTYRSRLVLSSIAESLRDVSYQKARAILDSVMLNILDTNLSTAELLAAFEMAFDLRGTPIESFRLPIDGTFQSLNYYGNATQTVDYAPNREALRQLLFTETFVVSD